MPLYYYLVLNPTKAVEQNKKILHDCSLFIFHTHAPQQCPTNIRKTTAHLLSSGVARRHSAFSGSPPRNGSSTTHTSVTLRSRHNASKSLMALALSCVHAKCNARTVYWPVKITRTPVDSSSSSSSTRVSPEELYSAHRAPTLSLSRLLRPAGVLQHHMVSLNCGSPSCGQPSSALLFAGPRACASISRRGRKKSMSRERAHRARERESRR